MTQKQRLWVNFFWLAFALLSSLAAASGIPSTAGGGPIQ
jgi:hypothetical protein